MQTKAKADKGLRKRGGIFLANFMDILPVQDVYNSININSRQCIRCFHIMNRSSSDGCRAAFSGNQCKLL